MNKNKCKKFLGIGFSMMLLFGLGSCKKTTSNVVQPNVSVNNNVMPMGMKNVSLEGVNFNSELSSSVVDKEIKNKDKEVNYDKSTSTIITLNNNSVNFKGNGVVVNNSTVTINKAGTYIISGNLNNGQIIVDVDKTEDVRIVLENVNINSNTSSAIYVKNADKLILTLPKGTTNNLSGGTVYKNIDENNIDGVIFSKDDLTINGEGTLNINAKYKHGIVSKNDLNILGGTFNINSVSQGLSAKDAVKIYGGVFNITSRGKGIKSENVDEKEKGNIYIAGGKFSLNTLDDAFHSSGSIVVDNGNFAITTQDDGFHADKDVVINGGNIKVTAYEGIEGYKVVINGGDINITSSDDGINAASPNNANTQEVTENSVSENNGSVVKTSLGIQDTINNKMQISTLSIWGNGTNKVPPHNGGMGKPRTDNGMVNDVNAYIKVTGGNVKITASGDGIDSNGSILVTGGNLLVGTSGKGDGALDYNGGAKIDGGTVIAVGDAGMNQSFGSESKQYSISYSVPIQQSNNRSIKLIDDSGKAVVSWDNPPKGYSAVVISSPDLKQNGNYKLQTGSDVVDLVLKDIVTTNITKEMGGRGGKKQRPNESPMNNQNSNSTNQTKIVDGI